MPVELVRDGLRAAGTTQQRPTNAALGFLYMDTTLSAIIASDGAGGWVVPAGGGSLPDPVTVPHGGTGATTLTGLVKGNGASAFTAAVAGTDYIGALAQDLFTDANNTALHSHTMNIGAGWTEVDSTWFIQSNQAKVNSSGASSFATVDPGVADCTIKCDITTPATGTIDQGIVFNFQDDQNYWLVAGGFSGTWHLYKSIANSITEVAAAGAIANATTYVLKIQTLGDSIRVMLNEVLLFNQTISSRQLKTLTKAGIRVTSSDNGTTFDNFVITGAGTFGV